jgi:hypothetical protein
VKKVFSTHPFHEKQALDKVKVSAKTVLKKCNACVPLSDLQAKNGQPQ